jgi:hypothetical protein
MNCFPGATLMMPRVRGFACRRFGSMNENALSS